MRSMDEQKHEIAQRTYASFPSEQRGISASESAFLQPVYNQFASSFGQIPVLYVSLGVNAQDMESQPFPRNNPN